jgi:hypothetical protein
MVWWFKPWCVSTSSWVQSLMDVCSNVFRINVVYKHVHHGEWCENLFINKIEGRKNTKKKV